MLKRCLRIVSYVSIVLVVGCAAQQLKSYEMSGFLKDYTKFKPGQEGQPNLVYFNPNRNLRIYDKVLIDHVVVFFSSESPNKGVAPEQLTELTRYFHKALVDVLKEDYTIVQRPGEGVMRIRTAITDIEPGRPVGGAASTIIPVGAAISIIKKSTTGSHMAVGRASIEMELVDSKTGMRLAAAIDRREGGKQLVTGKWTAIQEAFEYWAHKLKAWLDQEKAKGV